MNELTEFLNRISACDLIVLTLVSADRLYCRFFREGLYRDRMFVSDPVLLAELMKLSGKGEEISTAGIAKLKQTFLAV
ncbi:hypothetical protein [Pontibacter harenae]|uniref:hypothetical protein n=1 Tax=Pontibacter harenae TaxID=2894083 RepID=UPI001E3E850D|nr:hypothetical protein [Pontibacter harenae]MCC9169149.1 hypothetical protein [Pontibacter harenae]